MKKLLVKLLLCGWLTSAILLVGPIEATADTGNTIALSLDQTVFNTVPGQSFTISGSLTQTAPDTIIVNNRR